MASQERCLLEGIALEPNVTSFAIGTVRAIAMGESNPDFDRHPVDNRVLAYQVFSLRLRDEQDEEESGVGSREAAETHLSRLLSIGMDISLALALPLRISSWAIPNV